MLLLFDSAIKATETDVSCQSDAGYAPGWSVVAAQHERIFVDKDRVRPIAIEPPGSRW
jgi:hypothetical protein